MPTSDPQTGFRVREFAAPESLRLEGRAAASLLMAAGDLALLLDQDGTVLDVAISGPGPAEDGAARWTGRNFADLVTIEGRPKVAQLLAAAKAGETPRWRQVTHPTANGEVPASYACVATGDRFVAIGRDLRQAGIAQQRLLQAQQSLERDYLRLRQAETRYRMLFDAGEEAMLIVDSATRRISEANPAAHRLLGAAAGTLARQPASTIAAENDAESLVALLGAASMGTAAPIGLTLRNGVMIEVAATPFRQDRAIHLLVRLGTASARAERRATNALARLADRLPDALIVTDRRLAILSANPAFVEMIGATSGEAVIGEPLSLWLGRPGIDLELIVSQLREHDVARNVATIVRSVDGASDEVELSAVTMEDERGARYGFAIRSVARRVRDLPPADSDLPRSVEQLTELVGRVALKDIVRESTDLIERLCIEAALAYTSDNRASAAEILGLSRQSLYAKLHRHGLGNLLSDRQ